MVLISPKFRFYRCKVSQSRDTLVLERGRAALTFFQGAEAFLVFLERGRMSRRR
ncbi:hypothetical protein MA16_Dca029252 [Dendrobium catenatum]|uniref:Uncharacterized protein n=1 Tax=Dendrobium catenatum TaxID=906689 RepID=A0A2I0V9H6_9ASPA|nr:hypothetical protein MA16_Dca029252 [Dendrobium catenatum]